jgi:hypothetical protein
MMDYDLHPPLVAMDGQAWFPRHLLEYAQVAEGLGFRVLAANDSRRQLKEHLPAPIKDPSRFHNSTRGPPLYGLRETACPG